MFSQYSSFIPLVLVLFVWGTFVTLSVTVTNSCYLYMPSWGPDLVNKLISFYTLCVQTGLNFEEEKNILFIFTLEPTIEI
jgi:hypothetical protein